MGKVVLGNAKCKVQNATAYRLKCEYHVYRKSVEFQLYTVGVKCKTAECGVQNVKCKS